MKTLKKNRLFYRFLILLALPIAFYSCSEEGDEIRIVKSSGITKFVINDVTGTINQNNNTIVVVLTEDADITNLEPEIEHNGESIVPDPKITGPLDFSNPLEFVVVSEDGDERIYSITVLITRTFIATWENTNTVIIPTNPAFDYNYEVDWENNGIFDGPFTGDASHDFDTQGPHTIRIKGEFPAIQFSFFASERPGEGVDVFGSEFNTLYGEDMLGKIVSVDQWGDIEWHSMKTAFTGCFNLNKTSSIDAPDLSRVTDMSYMFSATDGAEIHVRDWNTSNITNMEGLFDTAEFANPDVSQWNISAIPDGDLTNPMKNMFANSALSDQNYEKALIRFAEHAVVEGLNLPQNIDLGRVALFGCGVQALEQARNLLVNENGWTIRDDQSVCR